MHTLSKALPMTAMIFLAAPALAGEPVNESRAVGPEEVIDIEIINGEISISGWDRDEVRIEGELSERATGYEFSSSNGVTRFEEEIPDRRNWGRRYDAGDNARLDIRLPRSAVLRFEGVNAEVDLRDLDNSVDVEVVNGEIRAAGLAGTVRLETTNGEIDADGLQGRISLATVNGDIRDRHSAGDRVSYNAVNGDIEARSEARRVILETVGGDSELDLIGAVLDLEASTVSGDMRINASMEAGGNIELSTVSGRIELRVPADFSSRFDVTTAVGGNIVNRLTDDEPRRRSRYVNSSELNFSLNRGEGSVEITTVSGRIMLEPL